MLPEYGAPEEIRTAPAAPRPVIAAPPPAVEPRPRFRSREAGFGARAAFGIVFGVLLGLLIWNPFGAGSRDATHERASVSTPPATPTPTPTLPATQTPAPETPTAWTYIVRDGDSCMGLGQRAYPGDARQALAFCEVLQRENPNVQLRPLRSRIRPGDELTIPADVAQSALESN